MSASEVLVPTVRLGKSGLKISQIILGMMSYGSQGWQPWVIEDQATCTAHVKKALELGIYTLDTANVYSNGKSEVMTGQALRDLGVKREDVVILTKVFMPLADRFDAKMGSFKPKPNQSGLNRKHIFASIKASLERLGLDYVDMLQCHRFDPNTPIEETMQALHDVVQSGMVRYIGMSSCYAHQFWMMQTYAIQNKLTPFISMQNFYTAVYREEEREMIPTLKHFGVGSIPWSPLARGFLTRPYSDRASTARGSTDSRFNEWFNETEAGPMTKINNAVEDIAKARGVSMAQVALAWVMSKEIVSAPIVGTTKLENLEDLAKAAQLTLTKEEVEAIEKNYIPRAIAGHQ